MRGTYKNPTEDASPAPGGTGLPREGRKLRARNWVGFGLPRPWRDGGGGRHPHGSDSTSEPTPPIYIRGGATIPYIYIYIRGSFARTRKLGY